MTDCVFCPTNWPNLDILQGTDGKLIVISPLSPVTPGHVLVISADHTPSAAEDTGDHDAYQVAADLMYIAAQWVRNHDIQANIITSIGPDATQTVMHTHVHVVPRRPDDGLVLPWSFQDKEWLKRQYLRANGVEV